MLRCINAINFRVSPLMLVEAVKSKNRDSFAHLSTGLLRRIGAAVSDRLVKVTIRHRLLYFWPSPILLNSDNDLIELPDIEGYVEVNLISRQRIKKASRIVARPLTDQDEHLCNKHSSVLEAHLILDQLRLANLGQIVNIFVDRQKIELKIESLNPNVEVGIVDEDTEFVIGSPLKESGKAEKFRMTLVADVNVGEGVCLFNVTDLIYRQWATHGGKVLFKIETIFPAGNRFSLVGSAGNKRSSQKGKLKVSPHLLEHFNILNCSLVSVSVEQNVAKMDSMVVKVPLDDMDYLAPFRQQSGHYILPGSVDYGNVKFDSKNDIYFIDCSNVQVGYYRGDLQFAPCRNQLIRKYDITAGLILVHGSNAEQVIRQGMTEMNGVLIDFTKCKTVEKIEERICELELSLLLVETSAPLGIVGAELFLNLAGAENYAEEERWAHCAILKRLELFIKSCRRLIFLAITSKFPWSNSLSQMILEEIGTDQSETKASLSALPGNFISWDEFYGQENAKLVLEESIIWPIKYTELYKQNNFDKPSGVLLYGPTGSGKTELMRSLCNALPSVNIRWIRGPELINKYIGSSEQAVRNMFEDARRNRPSLILIDELDSMASHRGQDRTGVTDRIVNQLLTEIDGTGDRSGIFIVATTSRKQMIDPAILRSGRIDRHVELKSPDANERMKLLKSILAKEQESISELCLLFEGLGVSQIKGLLREAHLLRDQRVEASPIVDIVRDLIPVRNQKIDEPKSLKATFA